LKVTPFVCYIVSVVVLRVLDLELRGKPVSPLGNSGAAPATVSGEPLPMMVTDAVRVGKAGQGCGPASQETCRDDY